MAGSGRGLRMGSQLPPSHRRKPNVNLGLMCSLCRIQQVGPHFVFQRQGLSEMMLSRLIFASCRGEKQRSDKLIFARGLAFPLQTGNPSLENLHKLKFNRFTAGFDANLKFINRGDSISALVPGNDPLQYRAFFDDYKIEFRRWFYSVDHIAWKWARTFPESEQPDVILGIWGQYLTNEYSIAHSQEAASEIEIRVGLDVGVPDADAEMSLMVGHRYRRAVAWSGFNECRGGGSRQYSIIIQAFKSYPMNFFKPRGRVGVKIEKFYRYCPPF